MSFEEFGTKLAGLEEARRIALQELDALKDRRARLQVLERDKTALLETSAGLRPNAPVELSGSVTVGPEVRAPENGR